MKQNFDNFFGLHIVPNGSPIEKEKKPERHDRALTQQETERKETAQKIARGGDFENILHKLETEGLLDEQILHMQQRYWSDLESASLFLSSDDLKALTVLELYDNGTFLHSLETYRIARKKIERPIHFEGTTINLSEMIEKEGLVSLEQFYRACLLHDIGKVEIPYSIITSKISHSEWAEMLIKADRHDGNGKLLEHVLQEENISIPPDLLGTDQNSYGAIENRDAQLVKILVEHKVRCEKYVPVEEAVDNPILSTRAFSENDIADLESRGFSGISEKSPLFDIVKTHEKKSYDILSRIMKLEKEASLAGAHHDYDGSHAKMIEDYPYTISSFEISKMLAEFLSISDMFQAIKNKRTYKDAETQLEALVDLVHVVESKNNRKLFFVAYLWISSEMESLGNILPDEHELVNELHKKIATFREKMDPVVV